MNERKKVIEWMNRIESEYNTSQLLCKDLHLWPILKWYLFSNYFKNENAANINKSNFFLKQKIRLTNLTKAVSGGLFYLNLKLFGIKKVDILFASASTYRVYFAGKFINRFFQPLAEYCKRHNRKFLFADYRVKNFTDYSYRSRHFDIRRLFTFISLKNKGRRIQEDIVVNNIVERFNKEFDLEVNSNLFYKEVIKILDWAEAYEKLIKKVHPKLVMLICYYDNQMYGLNLAAYRQGVKTVDFQHGGQGNLHVSYSGFNIWPDSGYSCLPSYFWVWDELSLNNLESVLRNTQRHQAILGGNPWVTYLNGKMNKKVMREKSLKKIILFSLQPVTAPIPPVIQQALKRTPVNYIWWFRLHPRMTPGDKKELKDYIKIHHLEEKVFIDEPTELPLPVVLERSAVHISKFSGCILEANLMGLPNIIVDPIGRDSFREIIDDKLNFYSDSGNIWDLINKIGDNNLKVPVDFVPALDKLLEDIS